MHQERDGNHRAFGLEPETTQRLERLDRWHRTTPMSPPILINLVLHHPMIALLLDQRPGAAPRVCSSSSTKLMAFESQSGLRAILHVDPLYLTRARKDPHGGERFSAGEDGACSGRVSRPLASPVPCRAADACGPRLLRLTARRRLLGCLARAAASPTQT
jgi:hypothetical protein